MFWSVKTIEFGHYYFIVILRLRRCLTLGQHVLLWFPGHDPVSVLFVQPLCHGSPAPDISSKHRRVSVIFLFLWSTASRSPDLFGNLKTNSIISRPKPSSYKHTHPTRTTPFNHWPPTPNFLFIALQIFVRNIYIYMYTNRPNNIRIRVI